SPATFRLSNVRPICTPRCHACCALQKKKRPSRQTTITASKGSKVSRMYLPEPSGIIDKQLFVKEMSIAMRNLFVLTGASLLFCTTAGAWNYPQWEAFAGYNFVRYNPDSAFVIPSFNANGGNGHNTYNFNKQLCAVGDAGAADQRKLNDVSALH